MYKQIYHIQTKKSFVLDSSPERYFVWIILCEVYGTRISVQGSIEITVSLWMFTNKDLKLHIKFLGIFFMVKRELR